MTTSLKFVTLDVFTKQRYLGNQLGLVHLPSSVSLTQAQKNAIAIEFNLSETVFLHDGKHSNSDPEWTVDIFTADNGEISFAGHPVIGTACYVLKALADGKSEEIVKGVLDLKAGKVDLTYDVASQVASAEIPHNVHLHQNQLPSDAISAMHPALKAGGTVPSAPIFSIVPDMTFALLRLESLDRLAQVEKASVTADTAFLDKDRQNSLFGEFFYVVLPDQGDGIMRLRTRMVLGPLEDCATGSAATALCCYLALENGKYGEPIRYQLIQGVEMGRESHLMVDVTLNAEKKVDKVVLSGSAMQVMKGDLVI